jgi:hypothetical protein
MNELVAGESQVMKRGKWSSKLKTAIHHTGNAMSPAEVARLSRELDIVVLRDYRVAVGKRTREIVEKLPPESLKQRVDPIRLERVLDQGDVEERSKGIVDYWSKRNIAGLLLMPATRHNLVHLNEGLKLKRKLK